MIKRRDILQRVFAVKAIFLICGLAISSWALMVPEAKDRLQLNDANLGLLLLCLGAGAISFMPVSGIISQRFGSRKVIMVASLIMAGTLPLLLIIDSTFLMAVVLYLFGGAVGTVDVAMNAHAVQVQNIYGKSVMSSFHGFFSVGGLLGSLGLGALIRIGLEPTVAAFVIAGLLVAIVLFQYGLLLDHASEQDAINKFSPDHHRNDSKPGLFSWLHASVLFLGSMCFIVFLTEGAMLDWSAVFLKENRGIDNGLSGIGYAAFSVAMATMRLLGDKLVSRFSGNFVVIAGSITAAIGVFIIIFVPLLSVSLAGFVLIGIGAANIVPVFIGEGGKLRSISALVTIPAITTMGYAGQLAGPALLGFIAHQFSLTIALGLLGILLLFVATCYLLKRNNETLPNHD